MAANSNVSKLSFKRAVISGLVASFIIFVINGVANGVVLAPELQSWAQSMASVLHPTSQGCSMMLWTLMSVFYGFGGVWIYMAMRSRYGAGLVTALRAGLLLWLVAKVPTALDLLTLGMLPSSLVLGQLIVGLVALIPATLVGAYLYRE